MLVNIWVWIFKDVTMIFFTVLLYLYFHMKSFLDHILFAYVMFSFSIPP